MKKNKLDVVLRAIMILGLCACVVLISYLYVNLPKDNAKFDSEDYETYTTNVHPRYAFEEYDVQKNTISCKGWYVLKDEDSKNCTNMTVYLSTRDSHLFYKMKTTRFDRPDVDTYLSKKVSGQYLHPHVQSGFEATISRKNLPHDTYYFYVYYKSADYKVMTKLAYKIII